MYVCVCMCKCMKRLTKFTVILVMHIVMHVCMFGCTGTNDKIHNILLVGELAGGRRALKFH